jgi:hypothetical protein
MNPSDAELRKIKSKYIFTTKSMRDRCIDYIIHVYENCVILYVYYDKVNQPASFSLPRKTLPLDVDWDKNYVKYIIVNMVLELILCRGVYI